jgi:hypothetical protein
MVINSISGVKIRNIFETTKLLRHYVCKKRESGVEIALISTPIEGNSVGRHAVSTVFLDISTRSRSPPLGNGSAAAPRPSRGGARGGVCIFG